MTNAIDPARVQAAVGGVFAGRASREDAVIFVGLLKALTGFYTVGRAEIPGEQAKFLDGQRSIYAMLLEFIQQDSAALAVEQEARPVRVAIVRNM